MKTRVLFSCKRTPSPVCSLLGAGALQNQTSVFLWFWFSWEETSIFSVPVFCGVRFAQRFQQSWEIPHAVCYEALMVEMFPQEGLMLIRRRRHQLCGPSPAEICHCSADTLLLAAKFLSPVVLQCPWILNCEVLCFFSCCCSQMYIRELCRLQDSVSEVRLLLAA